MALFKAKAKAYVYGEGSTKTYLINSTEFTTSMTFVQGDTVFFPDLGKGYLVGTTLTFANYAAFSAGGGNDPTETTEAITAGTSTDNTLRWSGTAWVETEALKVATGATGTVTAAGNIVAGGTGTISTTNGSITAAGATVSITSQGSGGLVSGTASVQGNVTLNDGSGNTVLLKGAAAETVNVGSGSNNGIIGNLADPTTANQASNKQYVDAEDGFIRTFIGKGAAGSETPTYTSTVYVDSGDDLETAISELDLNVSTAISALSSGVAWKGVARIMTGSGVAGAIDLSSAANSPVALPGTGTDYFVDDNTPTQTLIGQDTIAVNEFILYAGAGTDLLWKRVGTNLVVQSSPATSDTYGVLVDLVQTSDVLENNAAIYTYNSSSTWIKIGEFAVGQIQDGSVANTLPTWNSTDATWKQNDGLTLVGTAITGTAATALSLTAASGQNINLNTSGAGGDIEAISTGGYAWILGGTQAAFGIYAQDAYVVFDSVGNSEYRTDALSLRAQVNKSVLHDKTTMKTVTGLTTITGDTTNTSTTISNISASDIAKLYVDMRISGTGLVSCYIVSISTSSIVVSTAATATNSGVSFTLKAHSIADAQYIREEVVLRNYNGALADAGTLALVVGTGADISVKVVGSGANANKVYTSKITAALLTATTVDSSEFGIVGNLSGVSIALTATASVITVTVTNGTGAAAAVSIQALPLT